MGSLRFTGEQRVMALLLLFVPATFITAVLGLPSWLQFFLAVAAIIPLAAFIGAATEALADRVGGKIGGLLNATFGNSPDLLVGVFGVQKGLIPLVKATLVGALISNSALIIGLCCVVAGLRFGRPRFNRHEAGHHSVLMMLTLAAVLFASVASFALCKSDQCAAGSPASSTLMHVSLGISVVLLLAYTAYVLYGVFGLETLRRPQPTGRNTRFLVKLEVNHRVGWPVWFSAVVLAGSTVLLIPITDILTGAVTPVTGLLGWSQVFVGMVIVANAGNVAEGYAALKLAWQRGGMRPEDGDTGLDLSLGIASASSIQIATFVAPLVVIYSLFGHNMNLVFSPIEIGILALLVIIFAYICQDGESNWLEGAQLIALYIMAAVVFYSLPERAFGG